MRQNGAIIASLCALIVSCGGGAPEFAQCSSAADDGKACAAQSVCQGGQCLQCTPGASCTAASSPACVSQYGDDCNCQVGTIECTQGITCANLQVAPDGTDCGSRFQGFHCRSGVCKDERCGGVGAGGVCQETDCKISLCTTFGGSASCEPLHPKADGTPCGTGMVCTGGVCG